MTKKRKKTLACLIATIRIVSLATLYSIPETFGSSLRVHIYEFHLGCNGSLYNSSFLELLHEFINVFNLHHQ
jgi:hypothetical protein